MPSQVFKSWAIAEIRSLCSVLARWMTEPCYPSVAVITVASVLHRKQLLFSSQPVRLAYLWVNIPSYTHPYKSRQPKPARKLSAQFEVCCTHFFQYLQAWHLTCQKHCSCWLSVVLPQFLKIISVVLPAWHRDRGMRRIQLFGVVLSLYSMCFPVAVCAPFLFVLRGDELWEMLKLQFVNVPWRLLWCFAGCCSGWYSALCPLDVRYIKKFLHIGFKTVKPRTFLFIYLYFFLRRPTFSCRHSLRLDWHQELLWTKSPAKKR